MPTIPPGILFLSQITPKVLSPLVLVYGCQRYSSLAFSTYVWALCYAFTIPVLLLVQSLRAYLREERDIRRLGARRLPRYPNAWPGGIDLILESVHAGTHGRFDDVWRKLAVTVGHTAEVNVLGGSLVLSTEPEVIKAVLATQFDNFEKGKLFNWYFESVLGTGVFNADGELWKFHRGITRPYFARERISDFDIFDHHADLAVKKMKLRFAEGEAIDFQDIVARFTLDSATEFLFGSCVQSLSAAIPYSWNSPRVATITEPHPSDNFARAFNHAQDQIALRNRIGVVWPLFEFWKDKTADDMQIIYEYIDPIIKEALAKKSIKNKDDKLDDRDETARTLLDHLVQQTEDVKIIRDETLNMLVAGRDTTMATLTFAVYLLSQNKRAVSKLRNEVLSVVGRTRTPTIEDVKQCKYLRAVINETLRLYPPVPFNLRHSIKSTIFHAPDGGAPYYMPGDTELCYSVFMMHRRKDLWGPDAEEFDPERFLDERVHKYLTPNPMIFLPFNAGPRICLGQQFAYNEASFMLIRLLQEFDAIILDLEAQPTDSRPPPREGLDDKIWVKSHLTAYAFKGLWIKMREARNPDV